MSERMLIRHCAPTLAGIKTGSMFSCFFETSGQMTDDLRKMNRRLGAKGLRLIPISYLQNRALIYVYRPTHLARDLSCLEAQRILRPRGYSCERANACIAKLIDRIKENNGFPHEIGLFLGYPPEDVLGFMENRTGSKCVGCWRVYGDEAGAKKLFAKYKKCTEIYTGQWEQGRTIERLTVRK